MTHEAYPSGRVTASRRTVKGVLVVGLGNDYRRDDAAGLEIARRIRDIRLDDVKVREGAADIGDLIESWLGLGMVVLIDAVKRGANPGAVFRFDARREAIPRVFVPQVSSHGFGVVEAIGLAQGLGRMPPRLIVYGIEGDSFENGVGLSPPVEAAIGEAVDRIVADIRHYIQAE